MIVRDLRYAGRSYLRTPVFSGIAALVLAVAIAVATAVFSLYSHLALQPIAGVEGGERLVSVGLARDANEWIPFSLAQYEQIAESLTVPEALLASSTAMMRTIEMAGSLRELGTAGVSPGYFAAAGIPIALGTDLDMASTDPAAANAVISERYWREHLDARPGVIGSELRISDQPFTIVGVAGGGFAGLRRGAQPEDVWIPVAAALELQVPGAMSVGVTAPQVSAGGLEAFARQMRRTVPLLRVSARLPRGVGLERLQQELDLVAPRLRDDADAAFPSPIPSELMRLEALPGTAADPRSHLVLVRQSQLLIGGAVLVLLVASLNLASFMLARAPGRVGELRTRLAIGASGAAIVRQLFVEAAALIVLATAFGLVLHSWLRSLLLRLPPFVDAPPGWLELTTDWRVAVFVVVVALAITLIAGLLPALRIASQPGLSLATQSAIGTRGRKLQPLLVLQVAAATLVVLAGTLFLNEVRRLEHAPSGFDATRVVAGALMVPIPAAGGQGIVRGQSSIEQMEQFARDLVERATALPGVDTFAIASAIPFHAPPTNPALIELAGVAEQPPEDRRRVYHNLATPELFRVLGARFLAGRPYEAGERQEVVVSRTLARQLWGRDDVVGERLTLADTDLAVTGQGNILITRRQPIADGTVPREIFTVVGVVDDLRYTSADGDYPAMLYRAWSMSLIGQHYAARATVDGAVLHAVVDELVRERFANQQAARPVALATSMRAALASERARSRLALAAAALALLLTVLGLYASMQHMVDARRSELAVRKAIGATDGRLVAMVLRRAGMIVVAGLAAALIGAVLFAARIETLLLGLDALAPSACLVTLAIVAATAVAAAWWPAVRAGRVDPAVALRYD
jgi:putative ABC transport system permease protein